MTIRILVVEDSPTQAEELRFILGEEFEVQVAPDGRKALDLFNASDFDLVLTDVVMPELSGYELCRKIKDTPSLRYIPVILLTKLNDPVAIVKGIECGADAFIPKPFQPVELIGRIRNLLANHALRGAIRISAGVEVVFLGKKFTITSEKEQIIDLLLSTCEEVIRTNQELQDSQAELQAAKAKVEEYNDKLRGQVRSSEEKYRALMEQANDANFILDSAGRVLEVNRRAEELLARPRTNILGLPFEAFLAPAAEQAWLPPLLAGEFVREQNVPLARGEAHFVWTDVAASCVEVGEERFFLVVARDMTGRKRIEMERDELLARLRMQIDRLPLGYLLLDADLRLIDWNPAAEGIFGYRKDEVLGMGRPFEKILPPSAWPEGEGVLRRIRAGDMAAHPVNENRTKDGRTIVCQWYNTPLLDGDSTFLGLISLAQDVTERKKVEDALRLRDRAIQAVTQGILITDAFQPDNPIIFASPGFERLTGYKAQEILGKNCRFLQGKETDPATAAQVREAVRAGRPCEVEILNYRKDGTPFWNSLSISPIHEGEGRTTHFVGVQTDVTERRRLEEQYRQAQKMEAVGQLAGGVAHDFNNLLTVILGFGEIAMAGLPPDNPARELIGQMTRAGERAAALTRQLLAFSRQQVVAPMVLDLNGVVADLEKMLRRVIGEDIHLASRLQPNLGRVKADPSQIEQVVMNLAVNARDAMPQGGRLTIETKNVELDEAYARLHPETRAGRYVLLAVSDTGHGMTEEVKARIFEPFFTTKEKGRGTGLGLATVFGIVKQSRGGIEVYSEVGVGTSFKVYLPRVEGAVSSSKSHQGVRLPSQGNETVLLVEDEEAVRALAGHVLKGWGYTVLEASDGDEAILLAGKYKPPIHLLLTDVVMPVSGGRQLAAWLLSLRPEMKVLYMSGYTDDAVVRHGVLQEEVNFLQKPFTTAALAQKVREVLDSRLEE